MDRPTYRPVRAAIGGFEPETAALPSLRVSWNMDGKPMFAGPQDLLDQVLKQLMQATTVVELLAYIERILGPTSFAAGVVYGAGESVVLSVVELLDLMKTFVLAELYDKVNGLPAAGRSNDPGVAGQIYNFAGAIWGRFMSELLKPAADERDAILHEVARIFEDPLAFFGSVAQEYAEKYRQFNLLVADHSLQSQFAAGKIFGEILLEVILLFIAGAGAVKTVSKAPKLVKLAKRLKGKLERKPKKILGAGDAPPQPPSQPPPQSRPKPQLKEAAPDPAPPKPEGPKPVTPPPPAALDPAMSDKILYGAKNAKGKLIGAHSPDVMNRPDFKVKVLQTNPDGTVEAMVQKQWADGTWSAPKRSTLAPPSWTNDKILEVTEKLGSGTPLGTRAHDGAKLFGSKVDGVDWVVIKDAAGKVTSSYPSASLPTGFP